MKKLILISLVLLAGCSPLSTREKLLFGGMVGAQFADGYTSSRYIGIGGTEMNPILGKRPDDGNIYLFKGAVVGVLYGLGELFPEHRETFYKIGIISGAGATAWNDRLYEKHK